MLSKLIKYDFKRMGSSLFPYYLLMIGLGFIVTIFDKIVDYFPVLNFIDGMLIIAFTLIVFGSFFFTFFISVRKYYQNILKNEGYLTNTLPVNKNMIICSKLIVSIAFILINSICAFIAITLTPMNVSEMIKEIHKMIESVGIDSIKLVIIFITSMFLSYLTYLLIFYVALALGNTKNDKKIVYSFIFGICLYSASQIISSIILVIIGIIKPGLIESMNNFDSINLVLIISYSLSLIYIIIYYLITIKTLDKKLNLD